ncbi:MAG: hypothetical protein WC792_03955 [Candidatus Micrarchaeia archaeon]|jgi:hypothetical protein
MNFVLAQQNQYLNSFRHSPRLFLRFNKPQTTTSGGPFLGFFADFLRFFAEDFFVNRGF